MGLKGIQVYFSPAHQDYVFKMSKERVFHVHDGKRFVVLAMNPYEALNFEFCCTIGDTWVTTTRPRSRWLHKDRLNWIALSQAMRSFNMQRFVRVENQFKLSFFNRSLTDVKKALKDFEES